VENPIAVFLETEIKFTTHRQILISFISANLTPVFLINSRPADVHVLAAHCFHQEKTDAFILGRKFLFDKFICDLERKFIFREWTADCPGIQPNNPVLSDEFCRRECPDCDGNGTPPPVTQPPPVTVSLYFCIKRLFYKTLFQLNSHHQSHQIHQPMIAVVLVCLASGGHVSLANQTARATTKITTK
jgi:hypothetical protein